LHRLGRGTVLCGLQISSHISVDALKASEALGNVCNRGL
jgi:hypothetical protein